MANNFLLDALTSPYNLSTPTDIEAARKHAYSQLGPIGAIGSPLQGIDHVLRALSGRMELNKIDEVQRRAAAAEADALTNYLSPFINKKPNPFNITSAPQANLPTVAAKPTEQPKQEVSSSDLWNNPEYISRFIQIESGGNPTAMTGSYRGLGQFSREEERELGINDDNWTNPQVQTDAIIAVNKRNYDFLFDKLGRPPTPTELYLSHQQGRGGILAHISKPGNPAWVNMLNTAEGLKRLQKDGEAAAVAWAKRAISGNIPADSPLKNKPVDEITSAEFLDLWANKFEGGSAAPTQVTQATDAPVITDAVQPAAGGGLLPSPTNDLPSQNVAAAWSGATGALPPGGGAPSAPPVGVPASAPAATGLTQPTPQPAPAPQQFAQNNLMPFNVPTSTRPNLSSDQLRAVIANPMINPQLKQILIQDLMKRAEPKTYDLGEGGSIVVGPDGTMALIPKITKSTESIGDLDFTSFHAFDPRINGMRELSINRPGEQPNITQGTTGRAAGPVSEGVASGAGTDPSPFTRDGATPEGENVRLGLQPLNRNWPRDKQLRWHKDVELIQKEREKEYETHLELIKEMPAKAIKDAEIARKNLDIAKRFEQLHKLPASADVLTGPYAKEINEAIKFINNIGQFIPGFEPIRQKETSISEIFDSMNTIVAANLAKQSDPNPGLVQITNFAKANPGTYTSPLARKALVSLLRQQSELQIELGRLATKVPPSEFLDKALELEEQYTPDVSAVELFASGDPDEEARSQLRGTVQPPETIDEKRELRRYVPGQGWTK